MNIQVLSDSGVCVTESRLAAPLEIAPFSISCVACVCRKECAFNPSAAGTFVKCLFKIVRPSSRTQTNKTFSPSEAGKALTFAQYARHFRGKRNHNCRRIVFRFRFVENANA